MNTSDLSSLVAGQLGSFFADTPADHVELLPYVERGVERMQRCCGGIAQKYFGEVGPLGFNHRHTDQYAMFLYYLSNTIFRAEGASPVAERVYALNKALHAVDAFFEVELPDVFLFQHPVATVLGRARYGDHLLVYQRVSVGSNLDGQAPVFGDGVVLYGGSSVIGDCTIGDNCLLSTGSLLMDEDIPPNSVVFGRSPDLTVRPTRRSVVRDLFGGSA